MTQHTENIPVNGRWDAASYFRTLTESNRMARHYGFRFGMVSGLDGFEDALAALQSRTPLVCVSDQSDGYTSLSDTPHIRTVKTVFLTMPHAQGDMQGRARALDILRELFRQFLSHLLMQRTRLAQGGIYIDDRIAFSEIDRYFYAQGACAFFTVTVDRYADISFNPGEWIPEALPGLAAPLPYRIIPDTHGKSAEPHTPTAPGGTSEVPPCIQFDHDQDLARADRLP